MCRRRLSKCLRVLLNMSLPHSHGDVCGQVCWRAVEGKTSILEHSPVHQARIDGSREPYAANSLIAPESPVVHQSSSCDADKGAPLTWVDEIVASPKTKTTHSILILLAPALT